MMKRLLAKPAPITSGHFQRDEWKRFGGCQFAFAYSYANERRVVVLASQKGCNERWRGEEKFHENEKIFVGEDAASSDLGHIPPHVAVVIKRRNSNLQMPLPHNSLLLGKTVIRSSSLHPPLPYAYSRSTGAGGSSRGSSRGSSPARSPIVSTLGPGTPSPMKMTEALTRSLTPHVAPPSS